MSHELNTAVFNIEAFRHFIMSQQGKRKTKFSGHLYVTKNWKFFCVLYAHSQFLFSRVANLAFWSQIVKFWLFLNTFCLFLEIKKGRKIWLIFCRIYLALVKHCLSCISITKSLATRVYYHARCTEYCKKFTVALKMIYVIDKKQMHDSIITGNEYASKDWTCVISVFLTSFNVYFVCGCACFMYAVYASKLLSGSFGTRSSFFGEDRLANPVVQFSKIRSCKPGSPAASNSPAAHLRSTARIRRDISASSICSCKLLWRSDECVLLPFFNTQPKYCSYELLCCSIEFIFSDILTWSADTLYSVQCHIK